MSRAASRDSDRFPALDGPLGPSVPWNSREVLALSKLAATLIDGPRGAVSTSPFPAATTVGVERDAMRAVDRLPRRSQQQFHRLLRVVEGRGFNLLLGEGLRRFSERSPEGREDYLRNWADSRLEVKRRGFHSIKRLLLFLYYSGHRPDGHLVASAIPGYPGLAGASAGSGMLPPPAVSESGFKENMGMEFDAAVVGSGAGGALIAAELARRGWRTVILEAGEYFPPERLPREERTAFEHMFQRAGLLTTDDFSINILAGEVAGGSTTINWMTCLRPPSIIREEWEGAGLTGVATEGFDRLLDQVESRLSIGTDESQRNPANEILWQGCLALGYRVGSDFELLRRNARGCAQRCAGCVFGCPFGAKQSAAETYLSDAIAAGARVIFRARVERVNIEDQRATGVEATVSTGGSPTRVAVRARAVIVAGGAIQTPALLRRSGLTSRGVGAGLRLHPTTAVVGEFEHPVRSWQGPMQTVAIRKFQGVDPPLHGPWIEVAPAHPGLAAQALPWRGAAEHRTRWMAFDRGVAAIVLVRDTGEGRVGIDPQGRASVRYRLAP
jgi:long-chain-alcohol oxidase